MTSTRGTESLGVVGGFAGLADALTGDLITPAHEGYDQARAVYNAMIDRLPGAVALCTSVADVVACVKHARATGTDLAVRGGAHNAGGLGVWDGALVVDLRGLNDITVDPAAGTVQVGGGCLWREVDAATFEHGMATPCGFIASTGVGGLALGGGVGYLTRRFGMTVDNMVSAQVVLADGSVVVADETSHPDLFWALRGGGGNFGVVTQFTFRCHPIGDHGTVIGGPVLYAMEDAGEVMRWYRDLLPSLPEELNGWFGLITIPPAPPFPEELHGRKAAVILWCYTGDPARADEVLAPVREFGSPLLDGLHSLPFPMLQGAFDALYPAGLQWYWRADTYETISDTAIEAHLKFGAELPTGHSTMHLYPIDGAAARVAPDATAFPYRSGGWTGTIVGVDPDPANNELITQWARDYWEALHPTSVGGAYVNFLQDDEGSDRVRDAYGANFERLRQVKTTYDPGNFFHINQNIPPR